MLAVDAVLGKVADINRTKFGYVAASFLTRRMQAVVRDDVTADTAVYKDGDIVPVGGATVFVSQSMRVQQRVDVQIKNNLHDIVIIILTDKISKY